MADFDKRLGDYVEVKDRIRMFYEAFPDGRLVTAHVQATSEPDGVPRVWVEAAAYRTPDDPQPGRGWSWMVLPGSTPYTKGSELENTETSAWGRAIGALGIGIDKSIASANEVRAKSGGTDSLEQVDGGGLLGIAEATDKSTSDFMVRQTPEGPALGFRLRGDKGGILVEARGPLAVQLAAFRDAVVGRRVTAWGRVHDVVVPPSGTKKGFTYQALAATRVRVPEIGDLPTDAEPMFTDEEQAAIDEALGVLP